MTTSSNNSIREEIEKLFSFVQTAQRLIHQGGIVDVSSLQEKIEHLCAIVEKLPPQQGRDVLSDIEKLFNVIDRLEKDLDLQHDAVTQALKSSEPHANPLLAQEVTEENED